MLCHPEISFFEAVRISSAQSVIARPGFLRSWQSHELSIIICRIEKLLDCGIGMNEILIMSDKKHRTPQNNRASG